MALAVRGPCRQHGPMAEGPDIARIAALIGDPARAAILTALLSGKALTAKELAGEAGVTAATASGHLAQLSEAGLLWQRKQGRHRYYALQDADVAAALEGLAGLAALKGHLRTRPGPRDAAMRSARICYDHLAGARAVQMFDSLAARGFLAVNREAVGLSPEGAAFMRTLGIDPDATGPQSRPLCRVCLDWSERRSHLAGRLGAALLARCREKGWVRAGTAPREIAFTPPGSAAFDAAFPV